MKFIDKLSNSWNSALTYIATASYCIYLFHRPFLALWNTATNFISNPFLHDAIVIFVALPLLLFVSYHLQILELNLKKSFSHKKVPHRDFSLTDSTIDSGKLASNRSKTGRRSKL